MSVLSFLYRWDHHRYQFPRTVSVYASCLEVIINTHSFIPEIALTKNSVIFLLNLDIFSSAFFKNCLDNIFLFSCFYSFNVRCLRGKFFIFILLLCLCSRFCGLMYSTRYENFSVIIFSNNASDPVFVSSHSGNSISFSIITLAFISLNILSYFFISFSLLAIFSIIPIDLFPSSLILSSTVICY